MDWLSIIIAILVFVLPAIFEGDKKKKKRKEAHLPHPVEDPDLMEMPWSGENMPGEVHQAEEVMPEPLQEMPVRRPAVPEPEPVSVPVSRPEPAPAPVPVPPPVPSRIRKRRFSARDMVIYSEIMHPKYLEDYKKK